MESIHALIIDDDAYNVYVMERFLDKENISYTTIGDTSSLEDELSKCGEVDLILLDLEMPYKDGYEAIEILRIHFGSMVPIIACTVHTAEINRARKIGFSGFIAKPLDMDRFSDQISRILKGEEIWEAR
ncbi:response regulator [Phototrophicus methaneseepsis]|uniref:Response regulator n=1 Tax=Phototrophicus methaneseepsis TaxID=2710758 RepID=A0A7S8EBS2_9CHLR|nr:response regulator [Phototrophicus methaneseepsis]QPC83858.1 response regulator [Phototrophicus methaneseepsis]